MSNRIYRVGIAVAAPLCLVNISNAVIISVPADQPTIQACIDAGATGDECVVAPGTYNETINFNGKAITLRSTDPLDPAIVAATIMTAPVKSFVWFFVKFSSSMM